MSGQPDTPLDEADRWLRLAHEDMLTAGTVLEHQDTALRTVGFLAQQAAEKALKAALAAHDLRVPKTHSLAELAALLPQPIESLDTEALSRLTPWAEAGRYIVEFELPREGAATLLDAARGVVAAAENRVAGLRAT